MALKYFSYNFILLYIYFLKLEFYYSKMAEILVIIEEKKVTK